MSNTGVRQCEHCKSAITKLKRCTGCRQTIYCSKHCQIQHWKSTHKFDCKLRKIDHLLFQIAQDEKTGFMQPKCLDDTMLKTESEMFFGNGIPNMPSLLEFIDPVRYLKSIFDLDCQTDKYVKGMDIKRTAPCQQVFGIMEYLAMCSKLHDCMSFYFDTEFNEKAVKVMQQFTKNDHSFSILFVLIGLSPFILTGTRVHFFCVIKFKKKYRLIQSFGFKFRLEEELKRTKWMNKEEITEILNAFIFLESIGKNAFEKLNNGQLIDIANKSKLCLGFELELDQNQSKERKKVKHEPMCAVIVNDLSYSHFVNSAQHLLDYMNFLLKKFEKGDFTHDGTPLCYRMGYPACTDHEYLRKVNEEQGWGYANSIGGSDI